ncbi:uncharacterized protein LOC135125026 isoform X2 [Zophobas morio]|uniref:uncharacterized protein LOC135125026 isoform X2 n=1 Tax=Zophobas morio TaxID=2755281 RepID=UPI003083AE39
MSILDVVLLVAYVLCQITTIMASEFCLFEEKPKAILPDASNSSPNYKVVYCDTRHQQCCEKGCCPLDTSPELTLQVGSSGRLSPFVWFLVILITVGYVYFCLRYCFKKLCKQRTRDPSVTISRANTQPQEMSLMLSFNQNTGLERFNFDNAHIHVPFIPTTPVTPPPAYVTLTPPPTYNVAIHFPSLQKEKIVEVDETKEDSK